MSASDGIVFLLDVDNTLLDNDRVTADLRALPRARGRRRARSERYWAIFEELCATSSATPTTSARCSATASSTRATRTCSTVSSYLVDYPFANRLYPGSLDVIEHLARWGRPVILSDGDVVFQPRKVERSGLVEAVEGHVLIYIHKEHELDDVERRYPGPTTTCSSTTSSASSTAVKEAWGARVTTVFPRQGHYAHDPATLAANPPADRTVERIGASSPSARSRTSSTRR